MGNPKTNNKKKFKGSAAFTLIELLVVISIISFLASIVLSASLKARQNSQDNVLINDTVTLSQAMELYYQDNGYYPYAGMTDQNPCIYFGENPAGLHCIIGGSASLGSGSYSPTNDNAIAADLKPYMPQLPQELISPKGTDSLWIADPTYNSSGLIEDLQSGVCYQIEPNSYMLWGLLNNRATQANLNGVNSHGYVIVGNMPTVPCP